MNNTGKQLLIAAVAITAAVAIQAQTPAPAPAPAPAAPAKPAATLESILKSYPEVLAEVGSEKITKKQLIAQLGAREMSAEILAQIPPEMRDGWLRQMVEEMANQVVFQQLAEKAGFKPSPELVKTEMDKIYSSLKKPQQDELNANLKSQGKTFASYRDENSKNPDAQKYYAIVAFLTKNIVDKVKAGITDAEIENFYRANQQKFFAMPSITVSHIFAMASGRDEMGRPLSPEAAQKQDADAKKKIDAIYAQLKQGAKFEDLAEKQSECPSGKASKGKLPAFSEQGITAEGSPMDPIFVQGALKLEKPGQTSEIVKSSFGYHIIRMDDRKQQTYRPLAEVKEGIRNQLSNEKVSAQIKAMIDAEKKTLNVKINLPKPKAPAAASTPAVAPIK